MSESDDRKQENQGLGVQHAVSAYAEARTETKEQFVDELVELGNADQIENDRGERRGNISQLLLHGG